MQKRNYGIDLYRGIASILIFTAHYFISKPEYLNSTLLKKYLVSIATLGLFGFFALSSYLLFNRFQFYLANYKSPIKSFFLLRWAKIFPLWTLLIFVIVLEDVFLHEAPRFAWIYFLNWTFISGFFPGESMNITGIGWTLHIEEVFYLIAPLFFFVKRPCIHYLSLIFLLVLKTEFIQPWLGDMSLPVERVGLNHRFVLNHFHFFFAGLILATAGAGKDRKYYLLLLLITYYFFQGVQYSILIGVIYFFTFVTIGANRLAFLQRIGVYCLPFYLFHEQIRFYLQLLCNHFLGSSELWFHLPLSLSLSLLFTLKVGAQFEGYFVRRMKTKTLKI